MNPQTPYLWALVTGLPSSRWATGQTHKIVFLAISNNPEITRAVSPNLPNPANTIRMHRLSRKQDGEGNPVFPSQRTTTSNMSALFVFLPTNIWEDTEVDVQSHPPVQLLEGGCSKTKWLPLVNLANIRMVLGRSHPSINQWIQQLFIRNRWCARYSFRLHFFSADLLQREPAAVSGL